MYRIMDLTTGKPLCCANTKLDLLIAWCKHVQRIPAFFLHKGCEISFDQLNITGKDVYSHLAPDGGYVISCVTGSVIPTYSYTSALRRYQVLDDAGRSIDVRSWAQEIKAVEAGIPLQRSAKKGPAFRKGPVPFTAKSRYHRIGLPKTMIQQARQYDEAVADADDWRDAGLSEHSIHKLMPRHVTPSQATIRCEYKQNTKYEQHSWKTQTKSCRQYARHKSRLTKKTLRLANAQQAPEEIIDSFDEGFDACA